MKKFCKKSATLLLLLALTLTSTLSSCTDKKSQDVPVLPSLQGITFDNGKTNTEAYIKLKQTVTLKIINNNKDVKIDSTDIHWNIIGKSFVLDNNTKADSYKATLTCVDFGNTKVEITVNVLGYAPQKLQADLHLDPLQPNSVNATQVSILQGTNSVVNYTPGDSFLAIRRTVKDKDDAFPEITGPYQMDTQLKDYDKYTFRYVSNDYITVKEDKDGNNSLEISNNAPTGKKIALSFEVTAPDGTSDVINSPRYYILPQKAKDINITDSKSSNAMKAALFITCRHNIVNAYNKDGDTNFGNFPYPQQVVGNLSYKGFSFYDFNYVEEVNDLKIDNSGRGNFDNGTAKTNNPIRLTHLNKINGTFTFLANEYHTNLNEQFDLSSLTYLSKIQMNVELSNGATDPIKNRTIDYKKGFPKVDDTTWKDVIGYFNMGRLMFQSITFPPCENVEYLNMLSDDWTKPIEVPFVHIGFISIMANGLNNQNSKITFPFLLDMNVPSSKQQEFSIQANRPNDPRLTIFPKLTDVSGVSDKTKSFYFSDARETTSDKEMFIRKLRDSLLKSLSNQNITNFNGIIKMASNLEYNLGITEDRKKFIIYLNNMK